MKLFQKIAGANNTIRLDLVNIKDLHFPTQSNILSKLVFHLEMELILFRVIIFLGGNN